MASLRRRAVLAGIAAAALGGITGAISVRSEPSERVISILARKFAFDPKELTLKRNEPVILEFTSTDVNMGFRAPDLGVRTDIFPGRATRLRLVPDRLGSFEFRCDVFCGDGHEDMDGTIHVVA
ncbi:MAG TPA: cupredoxin domain-containing protein [Casimicrobiaceae bacterium]